MSAMKPWMEMGQKYGHVAVTEIVIPMMMESITMGVSSAPGG